MPGRGYADAGYGGYPSEPAPAGGPASGFGATTTAKIAVDANLVGAIIGRAGATIKHIVKVSGAKVGIRDHEGDSSKRNVEMEGSLEQIEYASRLIRQYLAERSVSGPPGYGGGGGDRPTTGSGAPMSRSGFNANAFKTRICEHFASGGCRFGNKCHFAHGDEELRRAGDSSAPS